MPSVDAFSSDASYLRLEVSKLIILTGIRILRLAIVTLATAASLFAGVVLADDATEIRLPLGSVQMSKKFSSPELTLSAGSHQLMFDSSYFPEVEALSGNSFLIFLASGEHACSGYYIWTTFDESGLRASSQFGSCSDRGEVLRTAQGLMLVMPGPKSSGVISFFLNRDGTVTENNRSLEAGGIVDPF